jgi:methylmalonyl-CoA/ethylmalonyl-CoA epimerase
MSTTVLDHVAVATHVLPDGWQLFGGVLGGSWVYGGNDPGYWWGQLEFRTGPKIELLTPTPGPDAAFLDRFLKTRGPGPHHLNFCVTDIGRALAEVRGLGIDPIKVSLDSPTWKEAFLHPRDAYGIVIQVAQPSGPPPRHAVPAELPEAGEPCDFALVELQVSDIDGAARLYSQALGGEVVSRRGSGSPLTVDLTWQTGACIRLVQTIRGAPEAGKPTSGRLAQLRFARQGPAFGTAELDRAASLSRRLGVTLDLRS